MGPNWAFPGSPRNPRFVQLPCWLNQYNPRSVELFSVEVHRPNTTRSAQAIIEEDKKGGKPDSLKVSGTKQGTLCIEPLTMCKHRENSMPAAKQGD